MNRRGFTLVELLMLNARQTARSALNLMDRELRMVSDSGIIAVTPDSVVLRVPYVFGVTCDLVSNARIVSLVPTDSVTYASAVVGGLAWLDPTIGQYRALDGISVAAYADSTPCRTDSIRVVPGGWLVAVSGLPPGKPSSPDSADIAYLYQIITYRFGASADLPGRRALWRRVGSAAAAEIAAPFDTSARFRCLVGAQLAPQTCPPSGSPGIVRGLEVRLIGASAEVPEGRAAPEKFALITRIPFLNRGT
jgi:hypothetical protein